MQQWKALALCGAAIAASLGVGMAAGADLAPNLDQGWSAAETNWWYGADQGSRLAPQAWVEALEQPDSQAMFLDPAYIASFRYLPRPGGLPVGFAIDQQSDTELGFTKLRWKSGQGDREPWIGLTCSACHVAELHAAGQVLRIEGAPTLADFQAFLAAFNKALAQTHDDPDKFARFAARVLPNPQQGDVDRLRGALADLVSYQQKLAAVDATHSQYGFGRVDAVGYILNKTAFTASPDAPTANDPDAPVSYPHLWNVPQQTHIQWDGIAGNGPTFQWNGEPVDVGALGRNVGEVIGVFGDIRAPELLKLRLSYRSSVQPGTLVAIEQQLGRLKPPRWPRALFPIDDQLARQGQRVFGQACASCHFELGRDDLGTRTNAHGDPIDRMSVFYPHKDEPKADTDPNMACNTVMDQADTGRLRFTSPDIFGGRASSSLMLASAVKGVMIDKIPQLIGDGFKSFKPSAPALQTNRGERKLTFSLLSRFSQLAAAPPGPGDRVSQCQPYAASASHYTEVAYKARPLGGIWATGPFLHNGSVPSLEDLLKPPAERPPSFRLGTREFDGQRVGYVQDPNAPGNSFTYDTALPGNSNRGHDYGTGLSLEDKRALLEYLKVDGELPPL